MERRLQIGVIGPSKGSYPKSKRLEKRIEEAAERIGELVAKSGAILLTGGCDGVMEAASRGAKKYGGITIGTPGRDRFSSNSYVDVEILTPIEIGDFIFAGILSSDALIAIGDSAGTDAELTIAYKHKKPIVILRGFSRKYDEKVGKYLDNRRCIKIRGRDAPEDAIKLAIKEARKYLSNL